MAANPAYVSTLLTDAKSKQFLEVYDNAATTRRIPVEDALHDAAGRVAAPDSDKVKSMLPPDKVKQMTCFVLHDLGIDERSSNYAPIYNRIADMSAAGMTEKEIWDRVKKAQEGAPKLGIGGFDPSTWGSAPK